MHLGPPRINFHNLQQWPWALLLFHHFQKRHKCFSNYYIHPHMVGTPTFRSYRLNESDSKSGTKCQTLIFYCDPPPHPRLLHSLLGEISSIPAIGNRSPFSHGFSCTALPVYTIPNPSLKKERNSTMEQLGSRPNTSSERELYSHMSSCGKPHYLGD